MNSRSASSSSLVQPSGRSSFNTGAKLESEPARILLLVGKLVMEARGWFSCDCGSGDGARYRLGLESYGLDEYAGASEVAG